ncbi:vacuolar sorting protein VPS33/slp1 [Actinomortierella ambigua]|uniref:Vacuolar sorting protein VPS33/slp1 n=1 Tax=Actinomortierella ambigua TaxID=1343610 RepID=A0A9P6QIJ7_9FUNG|nr:vacuolar sorting protein VPS33/slp1 [Actinomortierella ambigua]
MTIVKPGFLESIDNVKVESGRYKYVIVDARAAEIMASANCLLADVLAQEGTMFLENLETRRPPVPNVEAVYFLAPTDDSIRRLIRDFPAGKPPTYAAGHFFFLAGLDDKKFDHIRSSTDPKLIKTFKESFMDFFAVESRVFSLGNPRSFFNLYSPPLKDRHQHDEFNAISKQLVSLCATLQINPIVSYYRSPDLSMQQAKNLAMTVQMDLDEFYKGQPRSGIKPPHLMIVDRSIDPITPILHDFTYQALANDLLPIEDGKRYQYTSEGQDGQPTQKTAVLDDNDKTFLTIRHNHLTECIKFLRENVDKLMQEAMPKEEGRTQSQIDNIKEQLAKLPQFQENKEKSLATGELANGEIPKNFDAEIAAMLEDRSVSMRDRLRLVMLFFITQAATQDVRNTLFQMSRCSYQDRDIANSLEFLGVKLDVAAPPPTKKSWFSGLLKKNTMNEEDLEYDLPRYTPVIKAVIDGFVDKTIDRELYPFTLAPDQLEEIQAPKTVRSLRSAKPTFHHKGRRNEPNGRLILFVAGGMTFTEIRTVYEAAAAHNWDVLIGSSHIITPGTFMDDMRLLRNGPPPPPPPPPRSPSPPPLPPTTAPKNPFSTVKSVFGGSSSSSSGGAGHGASGSAKTKQHLPQPTPVRPPTSSSKQKLKQFFQ